MASREDSRRSIVAAALSLTAAHGWEGISLQAVRQQAGASNGSLFHHFPTRDDLAGAVVAAAMGDHQDELMAALHAADSARTGVTGVVRRHLRWVADNPRLARLLLSASPETLRAGLTAAALDANRSFFAQLADWLTEHGWAGTPPLTTVVALWLGPAQYLARGWLAAPDDSLSGAGGGLADGAWRSLAPLLAREDT